ncbi:hypothetical protein GCM10010293_67490 [Streptomyces griseoflavus]|uniref:alpha/beta hydrolase n=1 Tax=Streptomyces griseoflavus TaxID=35619 RepID=UPI00167EEC7D|nr:alpha/beta hydrolase [Streptomyces griseoflavus]GGV53936.1 hypothetical protein GCM10010293_67490 [Streptomyces griseoflavus]
MDLATLTALKPAEYSEAADGYRVAAKMASAARDDIENRIAVALRTDLKGDAATEASKQVAHLGQNFHYIQTQCGLIGTALEAFSYELEAAKRKLDTALAHAGTAGLTVNPDGSVTYPAGGEKSEDGKTPPGGTVTGLTDATASAVGRQAAGFDPNPHHRLAQDCADLIASALKDATEADEKWAPKLRALKADDDLTVSAEDWADTSSDTAGVRAVGGEYLNSLPQPPKDGTPEQNAEWWKKLSAEEQAAWVSARPGLMGGLDGLPASVRDEANRIVFDTTRGTMQMEFNSIQPPGNKWTWVVAGGYPTKVYTDEWIEWNSKHGDRYEQLDRSLDGMKAIQHRFDTTGTNGLPEAYLLDFSAENDGRAIVANGNPDTADHTAVYVPGTGSDLKGVGGNIARMVDVWRKATDEADGGSVSTITWLGYDAPDTVEKDAPFEHYAYDGAPAFRNFMDGLDASRAGDAPSHTTVIAHSYGTTLVGAAAETGRLDADDVILAGSPGVKVSRADELDVPKGHVWNAEADGDVVPDIGRWGHGGDGFIIPSDPGFGANQMTVDSEGHSGYWDKNRQILENQALIVVGKGDEVSLIPPPKPWTHVK